MKKADVAKCTAIIDKAQEEWMEIHGSKAALRKQVFKIMDNHRNRYFDGYDRYKEQRLGRKRV